MTKPAMTRLFTMLLAFYVLVLTLAPCVDYELNCCETQHIMASQADAGGNASHHDACSPFCTCSCCNLAMEVAMPYFLSTQSPQPQQFIFSFTPRFISFYSFTIWEPPKLS